MRNRAHLLLVDDEEPARRLLARILEQNGYRCTLAKDVADARAQLQEDIELVITDLDMPGPSGLDLIRQLKADKPNIATLMVTGKGDRDVAELVLESGAYGFLAKPLDPDAVVISVSNALRRRKLEVENRFHREQLEDMVRSRTEKLWETSMELERALAEARASQEETIRKLALAAEHRDTETGAHTHRMSAYCHLLATRVGKTSDVADSIRLASLLHDIGKIAIPDTILLKPGPLSTEERKIVEKHALVGYDILKDSTSRLLQLGATIALTHHEWWDGNGYPRKLAGEEIPIEGRIAAVADVFDAVTSDRPYRPAYSLTQAIEIMRVHSGSHLDADLIDLFLSDLNPIVNIIRDAGDEVLV
jgi:putative two-component system response regulator